MVMANYNSKEEIVARLEKALKEVEVLEMKRSRTPEEEKRYQELSLELTQLDTTLKAMDGRIM
jgi:phage-related tail protein